MLLGILMVSILLLGSAVFSAMETAFTSLSVDQIHELEQRSGPQGRRVARLIRRPNVLLTTILIGNNLANIGAAALVTLLTERFFGIPYVTAASGVLTLTVLIFCEVSPKRIALAHNARTARFTAGALTVLSIVLRPVVLLVTGISTLLTRVFTRGAAPGLSLSSILSMISAGEKAGVVNESEGAMAKRVFRLDEMPVQMVMTHRTDVFSLGVSERIADVARSVVSAGFSRVPVHENDPEKIVGIVLAKDMLGSFAHGAEGQSLRTIMRPPIYVPEQRKISEVFAQFQNQRMKMAVVHDEYGGVAGIVSLEDIAEEVFGEIYDETDLEAHRTIVRSGPHEFTILADTSLPMIQEVIGVALPDGRPDQTLSAYLLDFLQRIPAEGEIIDVRGFRMVIENMDENRILSVRLTRQRNGPDPSSQA